MGSNPPMFTAAVMRNAWCQLFTNVVALSRGLTAPNIRLHFRFAHL